MASNERLLIAQLDANITKLERTMKKASGVVDQQSRKMERRWDRKAKKMQRTTVNAAGAMRTALASVGGALVLGGAIRTLAEFEQSMATVKAVTGATEDQFRQMTEVAKDLGATTRFTASQAADGLLMLARAGLSAEQAMAALPDTLNLAQSGALDLGDAADIVTNVLSGMRLEVDDLTRVGDVLTKVANNANTDVQQLGVAFSYAAPIANQFGLSLEETAGVLGTFSNNGIKAERAGTSLNNILSKLHTRSNQGSDILAKYSLTYDDLDVTINGLLPVLRKLQKANISAADSMSLFKIRGAVGASILSKQVDTMVDLIDVSRDAGGEMARVSAIMDDNLNGAIKRLQSAMQAFVLEAGEGGGLTDVVDGLAVAMRFAAENTDTFMIAAVALASTAIPALTKSAYGLMAALGPIPLTIAAITTAYLALNSMAPKTVDAMDKFNDSLNATRDLIPGFEDKVAQARVEIQGLGEDAEEAADSFMNLVGRMVQVANQSRSIQLVRQQQSLMDQVAAAQNRLRGGFTGTASQYEAYKSEAQQIIDQGLAAIEAIQQEIDNLEYTPLEVFMEGIKSGEVKDALTVTSDSTSTPEGAATAAASGAAPESLGGFGREERVGLDPVPDRQPVNLNPFADFDRQAALKAKEEADALVEATQEKREEFREVFSGAMKQAIESGNFGNAIKSVFADRAAAGLEKALDKLSDAIFDAFSGSGGFGGFLSSLFGKAGGGPVQAGKPYRVGELGPEMFTSKGKQYMIPGESGSVIPNRTVAKAAGGGASGVVNNTSIVVQGNVTEDVMPRLEAAIAKAQNQTLKQVPGIARATVIDDRTRGRY
jgi:TP901 family phage tail tape measure protein